VEELWDALEGSAESDELAVLATLVEAYEREPIDGPSIIGDYAHFYGNMQAV